MEFLCDNLYNNFENYKNNLVTGFNHFGKVNRKKVDNRLTERFDFPPGYNRFGNRNRKKVDNRSIVKLLNQFPQSGETILPLSLGSDTIFDAIKKRFKCPFTFHTLERDF